ncbi:MAG: PorV/PorQ family protein [Candidatus Neomarinimicrobiota bacterium]|nr:PorV/PorQ family protein [Candidatus Neomarinimicrobiota bacterium]MDD3965694.1 PorV/PorQ family protein [Candidatus Neomarinimicrobiota bacterium]MDX9780504.1 PorV/PorQ family protein [bacterium]
MKKIFTFVIAIASLLPGFVKAQDKVGTTAANFLNIPIGGKAISMGGAYTAIADDATALFWNPGAVARSGRSDVYTSVTNYFVDARHTWFGAQYFLSSADVIGVSLNSLNYGDWEKVTTVENPEGTGEYWQASDLAMALTYARSMTDRFSIGGSVKYIRQQIYNESASTVAIDLGLLFITQFNGLQIGASIRNFGGSMEMRGRDLLTQVDLDPESQGNNENIVSYLKTDKWAIPLTYVIGVAMPVIDRDLTSLVLAADVMRPTNDAQILNLGADLKIANMVSVRAGYQSLFKSESENGLTLGLGLNVDISGYQIVFDYGFQYFGKLGMLNTTSFTLTF